MEHLLKLNFCAAKHFLIPTLAEVELYLYIVGKVQLKLFWVSESNTVGTELHYPGKHLPETVYLIFQTLCLEKAKKMKLHKTATFAIILYLELSQVATFAILSYLELSQRSVEKKQVGDMIAKY